MVEMYCSSRFKEDTMDMSRKFDRIALAHALVLMIGASVTVALQGAKRWLLAREKLMRPVQRVRARQEWAAVLWSRYRRTGFPA